MNNATSNQKSITIIQAVYSSIHNKKNEDHKEYVITQTNGRALNNNNNSYMLRDNLG